MISLLGGARNSLSSGGVGANDTRLLLLAFAEDADDEEEEDEEEAAGEEGSFLRGARLLFRLLRGRLRPLFLFELAASAPDCSACASGYHESNT